jgi:phenylalanyl-tRNA synthetase beta chain
MRIVFSWLHDYLNFKQSPSRLAEDLTLFGHEVETIVEVEGEQVFEIEITPNRGDCLSVLGIAREIAAMYGLPRPVVPRPTIFDKPLQKEIRVEVNPFWICPRFTARIIDNVKVTESPPWLQKRLRAYGFRPINNLVDVTNYIMVAIGQPLHAFDYDKIGSIGNAKLMRIRQSRKGEVVVTLDGKKRSLPEGAIVIEDQNRIYDLSGIMGGFDSAVDEKTKTIILQGAMFDPVLIRKASKSLNLTTEASYRYERGVDYEGTVLGVDLATALISSLIPQAKAGPLLDLKFEEPKVSPITFSTSQINQLLGTNLTEKEIQQSLERLGFVVKHNQALPPSYRHHDIKRWQDLAEEVARINGYSQIPLHQLDKKEIKKTAQSYFLIDFIKDQLVDLGYDEVYSYSFVDERILKLLGLFNDEIVEVIHPLSPETRYLRPNLLSSILRHIERNNWAPEIKIFEIGQCFTKKEEFKQLVIAQTQKPSQQILSFIKKLSPASAFGFVRVEQPVLEALKIRKPVWVVQIDLERVDKSLVPSSYRPSLREQKVIFRPISKYPPTIKDLAFIVDKDCASEIVAQKIQAIDSRIILVEVFDEFVSERFGTNKKSIAFHIWMQDLKKPMGEGEVKVILEKIITMVTKKYQARLRGELV